MGKKTKESGKGAFFCFLPLYPMPMNATYIVSVTAIYLFTLLVIYRLTQMYAYYRDIRHQVDLCCEQCEHCDE